MAQTVTPGGHQINDELLAIGTAPRKIGNPLPLGVMAFATTTLLLSLYNVGVRGITVPEQIVTFGLFYGGGTQYLAGLWEFATGNTLGATIFCAFGCMYPGPRRPRQASAIAVTKMHRTDLNFLATLGIDEP